MEPAVHQVDAENPKEQPVFQQDKAVPSKNNNNVFFLEAAALLTIWSILVINEGAIRLIASNPAAGFSGRDERPAPILLFLGGLFEVFFGLVGLFVGTAGFVFRWYNTNVTKIAMLIQTLLGYFVFVIYVFVRPAFQAKDLTAPLLSGLSIGESKFLIALGVLTSFHFCLALQGGQFVFMARLICAGTGKNFLMQKTGNKMRAIFWNANLAFSGLWTLITGALINGSVGGGKLDMPFISPPNVGRLPGMTIFTGLLVLAWAVVGIGLAMSATPAPPMYYLLSGFVYLFGFLNWTIVQFGLLPPNGGAVAMHAGLVFMVVFMGPYFVNLASKERQGETA